MNAKSSASAFPEPLRELLDTLDRRNNSNSLWLQQPCATTVPLPQRWGQWLSGDSFVAALRDAEAARGWSNGYATGLGPSSVRVDMQPCGLAEVRERLRWQLSESQSYYGIQLPSGRAQAVVDAFCDWLQAGPTGAPALAWIDRRQMGLRIPRYFDGTEHDLALLVAGTAGLGLLLANGAP